jgi:hypothetical protein
MPPLLNITNTRSFWKRDREAEYARWWKPSELVDEQVVGDRGYLWPTHITYSYPKIERGQSVTPIPDAPDPPPEPHPRKKLKVTREKATIRSNRVTPDNHVLRSRKIRAFPTTAQRKLLRTWFDAARHTYNWALSTFLKQENKRWKGNRIDLKNRFVTCPESCMPKKRRWLRETPYTIREGATNELSKAISDRLGDARREHRQFRPPRFRSIGDEFKSIVVDVQNFSKRKGRRWDFYTTTFPGSLKVRERDRIRVMEKMPDGPIRAVRSWKRCLMDLYARSEFQ